MSSEITVLNEIVQEQRAQIAELVSKAEDLLRQFDIVLAERNEAANLIEALRKANAEVFATGIKSVRDTAELAIELRETRRERDEARRMYCEAVILHGTAHRFDANGVPEEITDATELAQGLKWDCYGVTNGQHLRTSVAESSQEAL